jgi:hypothetical protein
MLIKHIKIIFNRVLQICMQIMLVSRAMAVIMKNLTYYVENESLIVLNGRRVNQK